MATEPGAVEGRGDAEEATRLLRNSRAARRLHALVYLTSTVLFVSGFSLLREGRPGLEAIFGGHVAAGRSHRWIGMGLIALGLLVLLLRMRAAGRFVRESVQFRREDLRWFVSYPAFVLRPSRYAPARHRGHFDPGQRLVNCVIVVAFVVLSFTGTLMSFPERFRPAVFAWSLRLHELATWMLVVAVLGHVLVASGILRAYRGVWRAMHGSGRVDALLARRLWPQWAEEAGMRAGEGGQSSSERRTRSKAS